MAAVLSPSSSSPSSSPHQGRSPSPNPKLSSLPPLSTNPPRSRSKIQRPSSYAKDRVSTYSTTSNKSQNRSRPASHVYPTLQYGLPYTIVKDFAYPPSHPYHYGAPPEKSGIASEQSTPGFGPQRSLSDPPGWENTRSSASNDIREDYTPLPQMAYGEEQPFSRGGPPYSEDEDVQSPVVMSSRHKKPKYRGEDPWKMRKPSPRSGNRQGGPTSNPVDHSGDRSFFTGTNGDGSETYYISEADEMADGPGGELVTYPPDQARQSSLYPNTFDSPHPRDVLQDRSYVQDASTGRLNTPSDGGSMDDSRYSRDYQFTIVSPDEEMHGKAVALFDFARENENELPLVEGQVIWVSYRHGQGWLVAEDPKTGESGLVPEEYIRLLRHIEGGWTSLSGEVENNPVITSPDATPNDSVLTPTQNDKGYFHAPTQTATAATASTNGVSAGPPNPLTSNINTHSNTNSTASEKEKHPPIVSTFSTSSKDLNPYPHHLLGTDGQTPPQVAHYGSQSSTPTVNSPVNSSTPVGPSKLRSSSTDPDIESDLAATAEKLEPKAASESEVGLAEKER